MPERQSFLVSVVSAHKNVSSEKNENSCLLVVLYWRKNRVEYVPGVSVCRGCGTSVWDELCREKVRTRDLLS